MNFERLNVEKLSKDQEMPYDLLLLADETIDGINTYIFDSYVYIVKEDDLIIAAFCLSEFNRDTIELENIAVSEDLQGKGVGTFIISYIKRAYKSQFKTLIVGTADCALKQINFYEKNGFVKYDIRKSFFIEKYDKPIIENGVQLKDMIMFKLKL